MKRFISGFLTIVLVFLYCCSFAPCNSYSAEEYIDNSSEIEAINDISHCVEGEFDALILDYSKSYFSNEEIVVACFNLNSHNGYAILSMSYENDNFAIISATVSDEGDQVIFELSCPSFIDTYRLSVSATLDSEETINAEFYALKNEYGVFTAPDSTDSAYDCYYAYAMENNILTQNDCRELMQQRYSERYDISPTIIDSDANINQGIVRAASSKTTYVSGTFSWMDDDNVVHPLRGVKVEVFDEDNTGDELLLTLYTSDNGTYSGSFENKDGIFEFENGGYDVFLRIHAGDSRVVLKNSNSVLYTIDSGVSNNISSGTTYSYSRTFTMAGGDTLGQAFQISQALITAKNYALAMGTTPPVVYGEYPCNHTNSSSSMYYTNSNSTVHIKDITHSNSNFPKAYAAWDVIMHEYGHHIEYYKGIIGDKYTTDTSHIISENLIDKYYALQESGYDQYDKQNGIRLAWSEGWASAFALIAQHYYSTKLSGIETTCDSYYISNNGVRVNLENGVSYTLGEGNEIAVAALLWDIYDSASDSQDSVSLGHSGFWNLTTQSGTYTFNDMYYLSVLTNQQNELKFAKNLSYYNVAASVPIIQNSSNLSVNVSPSISWDPQGGSTHCPNNQFEVFIFKPDGSLVYFSDRISSNTYTIPLSEWQSIRNQIGAGEKFIVSIMSFQTTTPTTGGYPSGGAEYTMP